MEKIENKFDNDINHIQSILMRFKHKKSKSNTFTKFDISRNSLLQNKNRTTSDFNIYRNFILTKHSSKDISNKNEEFFKRDSKTVLINSVQFDTNFLRKRSCKNNKGEIYSFKSSDMKNYANTIRRLNFAQIKKKKIDFIKYKFLLEQNNYYKRLFDKDYRGFSSYYSEKISLKENLKRYNINLDQLKKLFFENEYKNINSMKNMNENLSMTSIKNHINAHNKKNNYISIKIKKKNSTNIIKPTNNLLINYKNNILSRKNYLENEGHNETNKFKENEKIIDYNYNEYLKGISSSESNKSKNETNYVSKKNHKIIIKIKKSLNDKLILNNRSAIEQKIKRLNQNNYLNMNIKNNKDLLKLKRVILKRKKFHNDISKSIAIENNALRKIII